MLDDCEIKVYIIYMWHLAPAEIQNRLHAENSDSSCKQSGNMRESVPPFCYAVGAAIIFRWRVSECLFFPLLFGPIAGNSDGTCLVLNNKTFLLYQITGYIANYRLSCENLHHTSSSLSTGKKLTRDFSQIYTVECVSISYLVKFYNNFIKIIIIDC